MDTDRALKFAKEVAKMSDRRREKIGCILVYKNRVLNTGFNCTKTHPIQKMYNKYRYNDDSTPHSLHAEIHALSTISDIDVEWRKVKLYTYRLSSKAPNGLMARPCPACMAYIKTLGIKDIYYTTVDGVAHEHLQN